MSREAKALILTWVAIGLVIAGIIGFYLGRKTLPQNQGGIQQPGLQQPQHSPSPRPSQ